MPRRLHYWAVILIATSCIFFKRPNEFQRGLGSYRRGEFVQAAAFFERFSAGHAQDDTVLYYLFDCYKRLQETEKGIGVLEEFVRRGSGDVNVYLHLARYYRGRGDWAAMYRIFGAVQPGMNDRFNSEFKLTRRLFAELLAGSAGGAGADPVAYAAAQGLITPMADRGMYEQDTMTMGNLIIAIDAKLPPFYPHRFYALPNVSERSFLYLPYMRVVEKKILPVEQTLRPDEPAPVMSALDAVRCLRDQGLIK